MRVFWPVAFQPHIELLRFWLVHRDHIVERIQGLLNAQRKPIEYLQDGPLLFRLFEDCLFIGTTPELAGLRGQLEEAHWASGFRPREIPGLHNGLIDPAEMMVRVFHMWNQTRWPGRSGRIRFAHTLFNLYLIRSLELLSMRLWDDGADVDRRLSQLQGVLDELWKTNPVDQPRLVRDARWLLQMAQSPATDELGAYFDVAEKIAERLPPEDRLEIHKAGVRMAAGHLRSQIRYYATKKRVSLNDHDVVLSTRNSNALDFALLIQELVPLLESYEDAWHADDDRKRRELADAICQGVSPDPELFLVRVELLGAYSMIEHLFVTTDGDGHAGYTPIGQRHVRLLQEYRTRIGRLLQPLSEDCGRFRPVAGEYSPYGALYGFSSDLLEHMALKTSQADAVTQFGLEDVFVGADPNGEKLAWVSGWRKLPHIAPEVANLFDYPQKFAEEIFDRLDQALRSQGLENVQSPAVRTGQLSIAAENHPPAASPTSVPDLPARYIRSSDRDRVRAGLAVASDESHLLRERREGKCLLSYQTSGGWVAITKDILTDVLGTGRDARIVGLPPAAAGVLRLMCADRLVALL
jgi:hypothetical protein